MSVTPEQVRADLLGLIEELAKLYEALGVTVAEHIQLDGAHPVERVDGVLLGCRKTIRRDTREPYRDGEIWVATQEANGHIYGNRMFVTSESASDTRAIAKRILVSSIVEARRIVEDG